MSEWAPITPGSVTSSSDDAGCPIMIRNPRALSSGKLPILIINNIIVRSKESLLNSLNLFYMGCDNRLISFLIRVLSIL